MYYSFLLGLVFPVCRCLTDVIFLYYSQLMSLHYLIIIYLSTNFLPDLLKCYPLHFCHSYCLSHSFVLQYSCTPPQLCTWLYRHYYLIRSPLPFSSSLWLFIVIVLMPRLATIKLSWFLRLWYAQKMESHNLHAWWSPRHSLQQITPSKLDSVSHKAPNHQRKHSQLTNQDKEVDSPRRYGWLSATFASLQCSNYATEFRFVIHQTHSHTDAQAIDSLTASPIGLISDHFTAYSTPYQCKILGQASKEKARHGNSSSGQRAENLSYPNCCITSSTISSTPMVPLTWNQLQIWVTILYLSRLA